MKKKRLFWANAIQTFGTYICLVGVITLFVSFVTLTVSATIIALGAVMHIGAMLCGIKMDDGGRISRQYIEK